MRSAVIMVAVCALALTGCDNPALISLEPAVAGQDAVFDSSLLGNWEAKQGGDFCILRRGNGNSYDVTFVADGATRIFDGRLLVAGQARVMDLVPADTDDFRISGHTLVRILSSEGKLRWSYLDSGWFRQQAAAELSSRPRDGDKLVLTASTESLAAFLGRYAADSRAYGDVEEWQRQP
jgi:hypothetical protein